MDLAAAVILQAASAVAALVLMSAGLALIFGMMRVINLAQGEFLMLGAYFCTIITQAGISLWIAIFLSGLAVGLFGILVERAIIQFLYGRIVDTLLATWGLSLFLVGGITWVFGPQTESIASPLGNIPVGDYSVSQYSLVMIAFAVALLIATYCLWRYTRFGLIVRGTMQNPNISAGLGVNTSLIYMLTFGFGSMLTGIAGAVLVPVIGAYPTLGVAYIAKAFITVISGGQMALLGTISAAGLFGTIDGIVAYISSSVIGEMTVLFVAIILLRLLPLGITGKFKRGV